MNFGRITLHAYQVESKEWLLNTPRGILADDVGVGKTYPSIAAALGRPSPRLIVLPAYLITQWVQCLQDMGVPAKDIAAIHGTQTQKIKAVKHAKTGASWVLISYNLLGLHRKGADGIKRHMNPWIFEVPWTTVIFDEAHRLRGRDSQQTRAAFRLRAPFRALWFLTATPFYKNVGDAWPILHIINPQEFRGFWTFIEKWCYIEETPWSRKAGRLKDPEGFQAMCAPFLFRRTAGQVGIDLKKPLEIPILLDLEPKWVKAYRSFKTEWHMRHPDTGDEAWAMGAGALIVGLRYITGVEASSKLDVLKALLEDLPQDESVVIVTWYRDARDKLTQVLQHSSGRTVTTVPDSAAQRQAAVDFWKRTPGGLLIGTEGSMWEGLNLQHTCSTIIFYEMDWTYSANHQMIGRVQRPGQQQQVKVYYLVTKGTIDWTIYQAHKERKELSAQALVREMEQNE